MASVGSIARNNDIFIQQDEARIPIIQKLLDFHGPDKFYEMLTTEQRMQLLFLWRAWARPEQIAPGWDWFSWMYLAGRGSGKTRSGAEWVRQQVESGVKRMALIAATAADYRDTMIEGESGILAISPPWFYPTWEPSKRRVTWPNGAKAYCFSAEKPDRLRGPQFEKAWADEMASWARLEETYDNLMFGLRLGRLPQLMITTTPRPLKVLKEILAEETTAKSIGSTYDNIRNLSPRFFEYVLNKYEGTRLGRQEIYAEILEDNPDGIFKQIDFDQHRITRDQLPDLDMVVVPVDPAATSGETSADTGIIPCGKKTIAGLDHFYVLADCTVHGTPDQWGQAALIAYGRHKASKIIGEVNNGGEMVGHVIKTCSVEILSEDLETVETINGRDVKYEDVRASRGKVTRAEPVGALCEQGRLHIVGTLPKLEDECVNWTPGEKSPDRMDSMVWGITSLMANTRIFVA